MMKRRPLSTYKLPSGNKQFKSSVFRLNISYLSGYGTFDILPRKSLRMRGTSIQLDRLKQDVLKVILIRQKHKGLLHYKIAWQTHAETGEPHLDILLVYQKVLKKYTSSFSYLLFLCLQRQSKTTPGVNVKGYSARNLNKAIIQYGDKEDPAPLTSPGFSTQHQLTRYRVKDNLYQILRDQMMKDPFQFQPIVWLKSNDLMVDVSKTSWTKTLSLLRLDQVAECNKRLHDKSGLHQITSKLIRQRLTDRQYRHYVRHKDTYGPIIDSINLMCYYPNKSGSTKNPLHTKHLLIVSVDSGIGKTSLVEHYSDAKDPHPGLQQYLPVYKIRVGEKYFPPYKSFVYSLVYWDQFVLDSAIFPKRNYSELLSYLGGSECLLPVKNNLPIRRNDHPFHIMTSNMTLQQHVCSLFVSQQNRARARSNLCARIRQVIVPRGLSLHFLRKLFVPK